MNNNANSLIRDLDTLGVQSEVDLVFRHINNNELLLSSDIMDKEYSYCLKYNDSHKNKIISAEILYFTHHIHDWKDSHGEIKEIYKEGYFSNKITIVFSNHKSFILEFSKGWEDWEFSFSIYYKKIRKISPVVFKETAKLKNIMLIQEGNSIINEFFKIINSRQPLSNYR